MKIFVVFFWWSQKHKDLIIVLEIRVNLQPLKKKKTLEKISCHFHVSNVVKTTQSNDLLQVFATVPLPSLKAHSPETLIYRSDYR